MWFPYGRNPFGTYIFKYRSRSTAPAPLLLITLTNPMQGISKLKTSSREALRQSRSRTVIRKISPWSRHGSFSAVNARMVLGTTNRPTPKSW